MLKVGYSKVNVTPMLGVRLRGYFETRIADGVLDELELCAVALSCGEDKAVFLSMDHCGINQKVIKIFKNEIMEKTGLSEEAIYIHATHTHTGPYLEVDSEYELEREYLQSVSHKMADAAALALADRRPAKMGYGIGNAPNIAFVRRFRMKDGSVRTNPGVNNPDILEPIGEIDERVSVLRFDREGAETIIMVNFGNHPDVVGGCKISADWPGFVRKTVEKSLDNTKCIFFNGAQGDLNHVNVHPTGGYLNDMFMDFDDVARGYKHAEYMGRVVAGGVLQAFDKVQYVDADTLKCMQRKIQIPANLPNPEDLPEAYCIHDLHVAGKDDEIPYTGMMKTTMIAKAMRMVRLEHGPEHFEMTLSAVAIGKLAFIGIPGEPFMGVGKAFKETEGWDMVIPTCITNGYEGYFPMKDAYEQGGYEANGSNFKAGVAEYIIAEGKKLLREIL